MLRRINLFTLAFVVNTVMLSAASAKDTVIALSPYNVENVTKAQAAKVLDFAIGQSPGDRIIVLDGYNALPIGTITVPTESQYQSPKARINVNRKAVAALLGFSKNVVQQGTPGNPSVVGAVKLPQLLRYVSQNYRSAEPLDVIIIGSALYDDPTEPAFSMAEGHVPGDGHLNNPSRANTPFTTQEVEGALKGLRVHLAFDDALLANDRFNYFIGRFWTLYVAEQGGDLVSFEPSSASVFERVKNNAPAPAHQYKLSDTDKLEMIALRPVEYQRPPIFERNLSQTPLSQNDINRANNVELGISWDCLECDLDIYAKAFPGAPVLYFGNKESPQGRYWKDYTRSPDTVKGFETIAYQVPLDLSAVVVAVNFYSGEAPQGVRGEFRIAIDGQTFSSPFQIKATQGHGARGMDDAISKRRSKHKQTILIDLLDVVRSGTQ